MTSQVASLAKPAGRTGGGRSRALDVDHYVSLRIRQRRIMLGLTQQQMAELIGVTYQQAHKYERGINRITAGSLHHIAELLGVEVDYFFKGLGRAGDTPGPRPGQRRLPELARYFLALPGPQREVLCQLARALAELAAERPS